MPKAFSTFSRQIERHLHTPFRQSIHDKIIFHSINALEVLLSFSWHFDGIKLTRIEKDQHSPI